MNTRTRIPSFLLILPLLSVGSLFAQNIDTLPEILGAAVDPAADYMLLRDMSAANPALRKIRLAQLLAPSNTQGITSLGTLTSFGANIGSTIGNFIWDTGSWSASPTGFNLQVTGSAKISIISSSTGSLDAMDIGLIAPKAGAFTTLSASTPITVASGGTGRATSTTAYGLLAAGTTATGVQQTLPTGATTDLLVGGGASALPSWVTATGSGAPVRATSPTLVTPTLGTPTSGNFSTGTFTWPTFNQSTTGSAATLTTPRTINGVSFDGSANITVAAAAGTLTGTTLNATVTGSSITSVGTGIALGTPTSGNFGTGTFTWPTFNQNTTGNAATVTTIPTLSGAITNIGNVTSLGSFTSANLRGALTDESGTGAAIFDGGAFNGTVGATTPSTVATTTTVASISVTSPIYAMAAGGSIRPNGAGSTTGQITVNTAGDVTFSGTTDASSAAVGSIVTTGGIGVGKSVNVASGAGYYITTKGIIKSTNVGTFQFRNIADSGDASYTAANGTLSGILAVTGASTLTGGIVGTTAGGNATAGNVGEYVQSLVASGSAVSLTTATAANVTSISLTAGDWDVSGNVNYNGALATITQKTASIGTTSATLNSDGTECYSGAMSSTSNSMDSVEIPRYRVSVSATTTVYLVGRSTFAAGTVSAFGAISARRIR